MFVSSNQNIQQLSIDRSESARPAKFPIVVTLLIIATSIALVSYWTSSIVTAEPVIQTKIQTTEVKLQDDTLSTTHIKVDLHSKGDSLQLGSQTVLDASGHIIARRIATVSSRVTGKLEALHIEEGVEVKQSQVIAELDDQQAKISYQLALADLDARKAGHNELIIIKRYALQTAKRREQLAQDKLISQQQNDDSQLKIAQLNAQINNKAAQVEQAKQRVELAQYQLAQHQIRAPFDGVVISKNAQVGELISAGSSGGGFIRTGVGTIVDMSSLEIEVEVGESYINRVFSGQKVRATLDAYPNWSINSEVIAVIPTADRQKASIKVRVKLLESDPRILPDMGIKVSFLSSSTAGSSTVVTLAKANLNKES